MDKQMPRSGNTPNACYLLGFSPSSDRVQPSELALLKQFGVEHQPVDSVTVWFKQIERCEFEGPIAEKNLADIQWLTPRVLAHESVVSNLSQRMPFYPSRFGTLFSTKQRLIEFTVQHSLVLSAFFHRVRGKQEWGIKFFGDFERNAEIIAQREGILQDGKPTSGVNYLKLRQMQRAQTLAANEMFTSQLTLAIESLRGRYTDVISRPLYNNRKDNNTEQLVANIALLVKQAETEQLIEWANQWNVEQYIASAMRIQVTGPWPVYSFCPPLSDGSEIAEAA